MNDILIKFKADVGTILGSFRSILENFKNMAKAATGANKGFNTLGKSLEYVAKQSKKLVDLFGSLAGKTQAAGDSARRAAASAKGYGDTVKRSSQALLQGGTAISTYVKNTNQLTKSVNNAIGPLKSYIRITKIVNNSIPGGPGGGGGGGGGGSSGSGGGFGGWWSNLGIQIQNAGSALTHFGFVLGVIGYQFKQLQTAAASLFGPILKQGIELEQTLADVKSVSFDLNEDFGKLSTQVFTASEITENFNQLLQRVSGTSQDFSAAISAALSGIADVGSSDKAFGQFLSRLPKDLRLSSVEIKNAVEELQNMQAAGVNATQAILALTARKNFQDLEKEIDRLAITTKFSAKEIAEGAKFLALAGFKYDEIVGSLRGVSSLAAAAGIDIEKAADIAVNALLAFRLETFSLNTVLDAFAVVASQSNSEVEGLAASLRYVAPAAEAAGLSLQETLAALGVLADVGIRGTSAGTSLNNFLKSISARSDKFQEVLDELGISFNEINPQLNTFEEILRRLEKAGPSPGQLFRAFNVRGQRFIQAALTQTTAKYKELLDAINSGDITGFNIAETRLKTIAAQLELITSQLSKIGKDVFTVIRPQLSEFLSLISTTVLRFSDFISKNDELTSGIARLASGLFGLGTIVSGVLLTLSGPTALIGIITSFVGVVVGAALLIPGLNTALLAFAGAFSILLAAAVPVIGILATALPSAIKEIEAAISAFLRNGVYLFLQGFIGAIKQQMPAIIEALQHLFRALTLGTDRFGEFQSAGEALGTMLAYLVRILLYAARVAVISIDKFGRSVRMLLKISQGRIGIGDFIDAASLATDFSAVNEVLEETDALLTKTAQSFGEVEKSASKLRSTVTSFVEGVGELSIEGVANSKKVLDDLEKLSKETGETDPLKIFDTIDKNLSAQLDALTEEYGRVAKEVQRIQSDPNAEFNPKLYLRFEDLKDQIASFRSNLLDIRGSKKFFLDLIDQGIVPTDEALKDMVARWIERGKFMAEQSEINMELIKQSLKELREESEDIELELKIDVITETEGEIAGKFAKIRAERQKSLKEVDEAIEQQKKKIEFLGSPEQVKDTDPGEMDMALERLSELLYRRSLLVRKYANEEVKLNKEKLEKEQEEQEKVDKEREKKLEERKKAVEFLREAEIEALKAEGRELAAINKQYEFDVEKIKNDIAELQELTDEERKKALDNAIEGARAKRDKEIKDLLDDQNKAQEERTKKAEEAADAEKDIFKSLLGEVKNARDLIALYITLNQIQAARVFAARAAAQETLRQNIRLERIEERLEKARKSGNKNEIARLKKLRDFAAADNQLARDLAIKGALDIGAGGLANMLAGDLPQFKVVDDLKLKLKQAQAEIEAFKQTIVGIVGGEIVQAFAQAPALWVNAFLGRWAAESARIVQAIQATFAQAKFSANLAAAGTAAAGAVANVAAGGFIPSLPFLPDIAGGGIPAIAPQAPQAPQAVNINVIDNLGLNRVQNAIASQLVRAGHSVGRV